MVQVQKYLLDRVVYLRSEEDFLEWTDWLDDCQNSLQTDFDILREPPYFQPDPLDTYVGRYHYDSWIGGELSSQWRAWKPVDDLVAACIKYSISQFDKDLIKDDEGGWQMYQTLSDYYMGKDRESLSQDVENIMWEDKKETGHEYLARFNAPIDRAKTAQAIDVTTLELCSFFLDSLPESYGLVGVEWRGRISRLGIVDKPEAWSCLETIFIAGYERELRRKFRRKEPIAAIHRKTFNKDGKPKPWSRTSTAEPQQSEKFKTTGIKATTTSQPKISTLPPAATTGRPAAPTGLAQVNASNAPATTGIAGARPAQSATTPSASPNPTDLATQLNAVNLTGTYLAKPPKTSTPRGQVPFNEIDKSPHIVFLLSNSATDHICNDKSAYSVIRAVNPPKAFHNLSGTVYAKEIGDIHFISDGSAHYIENVYYLPSSSVNVLSQPVSIRQGWTFIENDDGGKQVRGSTLIPLHKAGTEGKVRVVVHGLINGKTTRKGALGQVIPDAVRRNEMFSFERITRTG